VTAPRRTAALVAAEAALNRARDALAAGEPGWDPWRVTEAKARYDAALASALDGVGADAPEPRGPRIPRMVRGRGGR
jgi:hypothetical protein